MCAVWRKRHLPVLLFSVALFWAVSAIPVAVQSSKSATSGDKDAGSEHPKQPAAAASARAEDGDCDVCKKKLTYAEQRADNAERDLLSFRQKHEEAMATCSSKQQPDQTCKEQSEALRMRLNEEITTKEELEAKLRQQEHQQRVATTDLRHELEKLRAQLQHQKKQGKQDGWPSGTIEKVAELASDMGQIYRAVIEVMVSAVPLSLRDAAQQQAATAATATTEQLNKVYVHVEPYVDSTKAFYFTYIHPHATAAAAWARSAGSSAVAKTAASANQHLDSALAAVYSKTRRSCKKVFAADTAAASGGASQGSSGRAYYQGRESAQTPQPMPPRPFDLEKRRKH
ncbi:uncharacterized protein LOC34620435 [Cyclospora cayetanensis]|uniref:Uncharacterized protein LOC34620435 n=1 Tax=Cyclospora cayetanensis TaxID=88456 RepID=A0A6P6RYH1_9EIME|nr:uncharacterized protein LOC34620435 [Cyclospora cayetanensis]